MKKTFSLQFIISWLVSPIRYIVARVLCHSPKSLNLPKLNFCAWKRPSEIEKYSKDDEELLTVEIEARHLSIANNWVGQFKRRLMYRIVLFHLGLMEIRLRWNTKFLDWADDLCQTSRGISCSYEYFHVRWTREKLV